ncbi:hypothetical protein B0T36_13290 [Nocardia donostiensis]|uniref:Abi-alpha family protein n=1 Tax=Nocardia donostiensis TaxID=1538463 RepID=UPI0009DB4A0A|nr:Abi-alpha family protein [Nocardia donostiensis]OQS14502.1 hypothetical protein B0T36_13290 [Nocardia donostiensis]
MPTELPPEPHSADGSAAETPMTPLGREVPPEENTRRGRTGPRPPLTPATTVRAATGLAGAAWTAMSGAARWGVGTALEVTGSIMRQSMAGVPPSEIRAAAAGEVRDALRRALGLQAEPVTGLSAETPGFAGISAALTSDETRILRLLHLNGPQPYLEIPDERTRDPHAEHAETGITLLGEHAGLRSPDRTQHYLANLRRLGLIDITENPVGDPERYQPLEAQASVRDRPELRTTLYYRDIELTDFGADFARACLPVPEEGPTAEWD